MSGLEFVENAFEIFNNCPDGETRIILLSMCAINEFGVSCDSFEALAASKLRPYLQLIILASATGHALTCHETKSAIYPFLDGKLEPSHIVPTQNLNVQDSRLASFTDVLEYVAYGKFAIVPYEKRVGSSISCVPNIFLEGIEKNSTQNNMRRHYLPSGDQLLSQSSYMAIRAALDFPTSVQDNIYFVSQETFYKLSKALKKYACDCGKTPLIKCDICFPNIQRIVRKNKLAGIFTPSIFNSLILIIYPLFSGRKRI